MGHAQQQIKTARARAVAKAVRMCFQSIKGGFPLTFRGLSPARLLSPSRVHVGFGLGPPRGAHPRGRQRSGSACPLIATFKVYAAVKGVAHDATSGAQIMENDEECEDDWYEAEGP